MPNPPNSSFAVDASALGGRAAPPGAFPVEEQVPESKLHLEVRSFLYALLRYWLKGSAAVGSDQFVYFDPTNPKECLAPDVFVCLGVREEYFDSWKVWERGTPELAVEIDSPGDVEYPGNWALRLERYQRLGVRELVRFDPVAQRGSRLRRWQKSRTDLVESVAVDDRAWSDVLAASWAVVERDDGVALLRLAEGHEGATLVPSELEEVHARRLAAERRIAELEEQLRRR